MENRRKILWGLFFSSMVSLSLCGAEYYVKPSEKWKSPFQWKIKPGTTEWARLAGHAEKVAVSDISKAEASKMSTRDLVATVMEYPLLGDVGLHEKPQRGFDQLHENFYGFKELLTRLDAGAQLATWMEENSNAFGFEILLRLLWDSRFVNIFNSDCLTRISNAGLERIRYVKKQYPEMALVGGDIALLLAKMMAEKI